MNAKDFSMIFMSVFGKDLSKNEIKKYRIGFKEGYLYGTSLVISYFHL